MEVLRVYFLLVFVLSTAVAVERSGASSEENNVAATLTNSTALETRNNGSLPVTMRDVISKVACFSCKSLFREVPVYYDYDDRSVKSLKNKHAELIRSLCLHDNTRKSCSDQANEVTAKLQKIVSDHKDVAEGFSFRRKVEGKKPKTPILREACYDTSICNEGDERIRQLSNSTNLRNEPSIKEWVEAIVSDFIYAPIVDGAIVTIMGIKEDINDPEDEDDREGDEFKKDDILNKLHCFSCSSLLNKLKHNSSLQGSFNESYENLLDLHDSPNTQEQLQNSFKNPFAALASSFSNLMTTLIRHPSKAGISKKFDKETMSEDEREETRAVFQACFKTKLCRDAVNQRVFKMIDKPARIRYPDIYPVYPFASEIMQLRFEREADVAEALYGVLEM